MLSACMALIDSKAQREEFEIFYNDNKNLGYSKAYSILHDEPFNGLDKDGVGEMREYLLSYKEQGKTILICSHSAEDIEVLCETVHEMDKGCIEKL